MFISQFFTLIPFFLFGQAYGTAVGMRFGIGGLGVTAQQQVALHTTVEAILGSASSDLSLSLLGEQHNSLLTKNFNFYLGGGVKHTWLHSVVDGRTSLTGLSGIAGFELALGNIVVSTDFKPTFNVFNGGGFETETGVSVRYIFASRYFRDDSWKFWKGWFSKKK